MAENRHVWAVWGSNGAGKTTLAANIATLLADSGYLTCLLSGSDHGELQGFFGIAIQEGKGLGAAINSSHNVRSTLTEARPNLFLLEMNTGGDSFDIADMTIVQVRQLLSDLRDQFPFVIIDCTPNNKDALTGIGVGEADKVIACIPHRATAANWYIGNSQFFDSIGEKTIYIDNNTREGGCSMEQLLAGINLPECEIKLPCVDSAYLCENQSRPIVLQRGRAERKYKNGLLELIQFILDTEDGERAARKRARREKMGIPEQEGVSGAPVKKKGLFGGLGQKDDKPKKMSKKDMKRAEEAAMKRAQAEREKRMNQSEED